MDFRENFVPTIFIFFPKTRFSRAAGFGKNSSILLTTTYYLNYWESLLRSACAGGSTQTQIVDKLDYKYIPELQCIFLSSYTL